MLQLNDFESNYNDILFEPTPNLFSIYYPPTPPLSPLFFYRPSNRINFYEELDNFESEGEEEEEEEKNYYNNKKK